MPISKDEIAPAPPKRTETTPLMRQYLELKSRYPQELLLFRLGDFYELFGEDAKRASPILEVALTHRQQEPMCGVPAHSVEPYIAKLLKAGLRVAIADQLEDPAAAKGIVKRDVVRVMSAGTLQEDSLLSIKENNFLAAVWCQGNRVGLAAIDYSTGEFIAAELADPLTSPALCDELTRLAPSEVVMADALEQAPLREKLHKRGFRLTAHAPSDFSILLAEERLKRAFDIGSLRGFGLEGKPHALGAAGAALRYLDTMQCGRAFSLKTLRTYSLEHTLQMDAATLDHLDLLPKPAAKPVPNLLHVLDHTLTPMGGRLLRRWIVAPLRDAAAIRARQVRTAYFVQAGDVRRQIRQTLSGWPDIERILTRLTAGTAAPRDLAHLSTGLQTLPVLRKQLAQCPDANWRTFPVLPELAELLKRAIVDSPPISLKDGHVIRPGFHAELDDVRGWVHEGKTKLLELEKKERETTGIPSLKVGFNNIFGYYLEVTKTHLAKVPASYHRKQTTANGERYITSELKDFETRILGAKERALRIEAELVQGLRETILTHSEKLRETADAAAQLDIAQSLAEAAQRYDYVQPTVDDSTDLLIRNGRHPVLQDVLPAGTLVPNDVELNGKDRQILILTGPNMSGKSTYLRQTALIAIMAQIGSFVPAEEARIGVLDALFTRIGASDRLADGESTFMVEMVETARILNHATPRSLVILDEVGRGTSTYDGMSIAAACLEYLNRIGPKVLFATHFFELTDMAERFPGIQNAHVTAREWNDQVVFLHKVEPGPADRAYGIHVARLAGVPKSVLERASILLQEFEAQHERSSVLTSSTKEAAEQLSLFRKNDTLHTVWRNELSNVDLNTTTPIDAWQYLQRWQRQLREDHNGEGTQT